MFNRFPKRTGIYHIKDNIEMLELKVHFRHINSLLKLPKFDYDRSINNTSCEQQQKSNGQIDNDFKIVRIKWQEKVFSAHEKELYKDLKNCLTDKQKEYHELLMQQAEQDEACRSNTTHTSTRRRRKKKQVKKQSITMQQPQQIVDNKIHTYIDDDNFKPKDKCKSKQIEKNNFTSDIKDMYIYASLDVETELAYLQWSESERLLYIYPDFNNSNHNPYFIEIDKDYRHLYAYTLENISQTRILNFDTDLYLQLPILKPYWHTEDERAKLFSMPPQRTKRFSFLLELREAIGFEYDSIHVRYQIKLPPNTIHEEGLLQASTHSSSKSANSNAGIHRIGYNWQLTLLCEEDYNAGDFLHIYFEVISIDSWERERVEGYTYFATSLQNANGTELHSLDCIRPLDTLWTSFERFFIGGRRKFDFIKFFGQEQEENVDRKFHCRYGCRMMSTGTLLFSCQRFTQRNCELLEPCLSTRNGMTLDDIMLAYQEARKRLEAIVLD